MCPWRPPLRRPALDDDTSWRRYRLRSHQSTDVVYETDTAGVVQWISPSVQALLGWEPAALVGRTLHDLVHPEDRDRIAALRESFYSEGIEHAAVRCMVALATGGYREMTVPSRPLADAERYGHRARSSPSPTPTTATRPARAGDAEPGEPRPGPRHRRGRPARPDVPSPHRDRPVRTRLVRPAVDDDDQSVAVVASAGEVGYLDQVTVSWGDNPHGHGPTGRCLRTGDDPGAEPTPPTTRPTSRGPRLPPSTASAARSRCPCACTRTSTVP